MRILESFVLNQIDKELQIDLFEMKIHSTVHVSKFSPLGAIFGSYLKTGSCVSFRVKMSCLFFLFLLLALLLAFEIGGRIWQRVPYSVPWL